MGEMRVARRAISRQLNILHPPGDSSCEACALGKIRKTPANPVTPAANKDDPTPPTEWGQLIGQDAVGPSPPAMGAEIGALDQQDAATKYPGLEGLTQVTGEALVTATKELSRGCMHMVKRVRT